LVRIFLKLKTGSGVSMNVLCINVGSTSIKYTLFEEVSENVLVKGKMEDLRSVKTGLILAFNDLKRKVMVVDKIIFRVVFGGEFFSEPTKITAKVMYKLETLVDFSPLHLPLTLKVIRACNEFLPEVPQIAVFDSQFHSTILTHRQTIPLPPEITSKIGLRRYGFHGISCQYIWSEVEKLEPKVENLICCHLGGGCSVTTISNGKSVENSMGFSPEGGVMMAKRSGNIDPGALLFAQEKLGLSPQELKLLINENSGLKGIAGQDGDMRQLLKTEETNPKSKLAIAMYCEKIAREIASQHVLLPRLDCLVFTGAVGEGSPVIRKRICQYLKNLGVVLDEDANNLNNETGVAGKISSSKSSVKVWVIPTNEDLQMLRLI
jgi:acetate kinase